MVIQIDSRQKPLPHNLLIEQSIQAQGLKTIRSKMLCGDYALANNMSICIDTKQNMAELYKDLIADHERFKNECKIATECGINLIILIPDEKIKSIDDVASWINPLSSLRRTNSKPLTKSATLCKIMKTMQTYYSVEFKFCNPDDVGKEIVQILTYK